MAERKIEIVIAGDSRGGERALQAISGKAEKVGSSFTRLAGVAVAALGAVGVAGVAAFAKSAIGAASDLNETLSKSNTIFGSNAKEIERWASGASTSFGQSKQQALDAAATFGNMFTQLGIGSDKAAGMSKSMVQLASDFASFHNTSPEDAIGAMTAAFRGEFDAVQRFVPTINAAAVEHEVLASGLAKSKKAITDQHKALAVQQLLMKGAGAAAGDFARTSDSLANRQRILSATVEDLKAKIGTALLPVVTEVVGWLGQRLPGALATAEQLFGRARDALQPFIDNVRLAVEAFRAAFSGEGVTSDGWVGKIERLGVVAREVIDWFRDHWKPVLAGAAVALGLLFAPITTVVGLLALAYVKFDGFRQVVDLVARTIVEQLGNAIAWFQQALPAIQETITRVTNAAKAIWKAWGDDLLRIVKTVWNFIAESIENALTVVRGVITLVTSLINGDWGKAWQAIRSIVGAVWDQIGNIISTAVGLIRSLLGGLLSSIIPALRAGWEGIQRVFANGFNAAKRAVFDAAAGLLDWFTGLPGQIVSAIGGIGNRMYEVGVRIIEGLVNAVKAGASRVLKAMKDVVLSPINVVKGLLGIHSPSRVFMRIGEYTIQGFVQGVKGKKTDVRKALQDVFGNLMGQVGDILGGFGAMDGRAGAQRGVRDATATLNDLLLERAKLPGAIAEAERELAAARAAAKKVTPEELLALMDAEDEVAEKAAAQRDAQKELAEAQADGKKTTAELTELHRKLRRADQELIVAQRDLNQVRAEASAETADVIEAEDRLRELRERQATITEEITAAQEALTEAKIAAVAAEKAYLEQQEKLLGVGPQAISLFRQLAENAGLNREEIEKLLDAYRRLRGGIGGVTTGNLTGGTGAFLDLTTGRTAVTGPRGEGGLLNGDSRVRALLDAGVNLQHWTNPITGAVTWFAPGQNIQAGNVDALRRAGLMSFDVGGVVPGPVGWPQLAIVHGGERVIPNGRGGDGAAAATYHLTIVQQPGQEIDDAMLLRSLKRIERHHGGVPIKLRS